MNPSDRSSLGEFLTLPEILRFLRSRWRSILAVFLVSAIASAILSFFTPKTYQASSFILVRPPRFTTELMPETFSIQTYQQFIENDAILDSVLRRADLKGVRLEDLRDMLGSEVSREKYGMKVEFSPLIRLNAKAATPEEAATLADVWAEEILNRSSDLIVLGKGDTLAFIEKQYEDLNQKLVPAEQALALTGKKYEERRKTLEETYEKKASDFRAQWNLGRLREEVDKLNELVAENERILVNVGADSRVARHKTDVLEKRLARQAPLLTLRKTLSDDALLESSTIRETGANRQRLSSVTLTAEEPNPVYEQVSSDLERVRAEAAHFEAQEKALEQDIAKTLKQADEVNRLYTQKNREHSDIYIEKTAAMATLTIEQETEIAPLQRAVDKYRLTHKSLSEKAEAARMAKEEKTDVVKIASRAVAPTMPTRTSSKRFFVTTVTAISTLTAIALMLLAQVYARIDSASSKR